MIFSFNIFSRFNIYSAPDHSRALSNKAYYEELIEKQGGNKRNGDGDSIRKDPKPINLKKKVEEMKITNQRPKDYLEERELYEQMCRQNGSKVNLLFIES